MTPPFPASPGRWRSLFTTTEPKRPDTMVQHSIIHSGKNEVSIYRHPRGREYALIPEHQDGWFLVLWERNGSQGNAWRVYAMDEDADLRRAEPKAEQSLEVFDDLWDVVTHVLDGKFTAKTTTR